MFMVDGGEVFVVIVQQYPSFLTIPAQYLQKKGELTLSLDTLTHRFTDYPYEATDPYEVDSGLLQ